MHFIAKTFNFRQKMQCYCNLWMFISIVLKRANKKKFPAQGTRNIFVIKYNKYILNLLTVYNFKSKIETDF